MYYQNYLQLIITVDQNMTHIVELEYLIRMFNEAPTPYCLTDDEWHRLEFLANNTRLSHYDNSISETAYTEMKKFK